MRKVISYLLLAVLGFLSIWGGLSCRAIHMLSTSADSTAIRSAESSQKYERETTTEEIIRIPGTKTVRNDTTVENNLIIRKTTIKEKGEASDKKAEEKSSSTESKEVDKSTPIMTQVTQMLAAAAAMGVIILLFKK